MEQHVSHIGVSEMNWAPVPPRIGDLRTADAAALADLLEGLEAGLFLIDASARILHANASGRAILAAREVLVSSAGRLAAAKAAGRQALKRLFDPIKANGTCFVEPGSVALTSDSGECWLAHVLPLGCEGHSGHAIPYAAVAAVLVRKAAFGLPSLDTLAKIYRLTPAELRILLAVVEIGGVPDIAAVFGISEATVKTHLRRLFSKTNSSRQADLVKLVAGFVNPLSG